MEKWILGIEFSILQQPQRPTGHLKKSQMFVWLKTNEHEEY